MAKVHFVKKARKDNPVAKRGESYYWWQPRNMSKRYSATYPRQSQLTSGKKSMIFAAQEDFEDAAANIKTGEDLYAACLACAETYKEIAAEYQESADNMPENLQDGELANNMREMADNLECAASDLESIDCEFDEDLEEEPPTEPDLSDYDYSGKGQYALDYEQWEYDTDVFSEEMEDRNERHIVWLESQTEEARSYVDSIDLLF